MRQIALTNGHSAIIDNIDLALVMAIKWQAVASKAGFYARGWCKKAKRTVSMHRLITGAQPGQQVEINL